VITVDSREQTMEVGDRVRYKNKYYWVVSREFQGTVEIAPTVSGIGGFMVHRDRLFKKIYKDRSRGPGPGPWTLNRCENAARLTEFEN
jgi:hypothetical protein